jgi:methionine-rich copper-binding protein CopC
MTLVSRIVCLGWGALLLLGGIVDGLIPRARYVSSRPEPGSTLAAAPAEVVVAFSRELHPDSTIYVVSTMPVPPSGETSSTGGMDVTAVSGLDPNDPARQSLRAVLPPGLPTGLYRVDWNTTARRSSGEAYGSFYFGVGTPVPLHLAGKTGRPFREDDRGAGIERERDAAIAGGVILIAVGIVLPWLRSDRKFWQIYRDGTL